jgi:tyrosyl-tRNA synthetase
MISPILPGTDGVKKMSKSLNNHIGITESPENIFGKLMSIPDALMPEYYRLLTSHKFDPQAHPRESKIKLAEALTAEFHSADAAAQARKNFETVFSKGGAPENIESKPLPQPTPPLFKLLTALGLAPSNGESKRLIEQSAVTLDGNLLNDVNLILTQKGVLQVGKRRFIKIV